jgi:hypothetical protein
MKRMRVSDCDKSASSTLILKVTCVLRCIINSPKYSTQIDESPCTLTQSTYTLACPARIFSTVPCGNP